MALLAILIFAYSVRRPTIAASWQSECWDVLNAIRLHYTAFSNVSGYLLDNFFKSILHTMHGTYDSLYLYGYSGVLDRLGLPINVFSLGHGQVLLSVVTVGVAYLVGRAYFNPTVGIIAALLLAVNTRHIAISGIPYFYNSVVFSTGIFLLALKRYHARLDLPSALLLGAITFIGAGSELVVIFPVWMLICDPLLLREAYGRLTLDIVKRFYWRPHTVLIWMPIAVMAAAHYYIYRRIGFAGNNLGMIGIAVLNYGGYNSPQQVASAFAHSLKAAVDSRWSLFFVIAVWGGLIYLYVKDRLPRANVLAMLWLGSVCIGLAISLKRGSLSRGGSDRSFHILLPACVFYAASLYYLFRAMNRPLRVAALAALLLVFWTPVASLTLNARATPTPSALAPAGWYVRSHGAPYTTHVFMLYPDIGAQFASVFWFGKQFMSDFSEPGTLYPLEDYRKSLFGASASRGFTDLADYPLPFDFVVVLTRFATDGYVTRNVDFMAAHGYKLVATVTHQGKNLASIYSPRDLPPTTMDLIEYAGRWDRDYGHLDRLFEHNRMGLESYWGNY